MVKKIIAVLIVCTMLCTSVAVYAVSDIDDLEQQQNDLQSTQDDLQSQIEQNDSEIAQKQELNTELKAKLDEVNQKLTDSTAKLTEISVKIDETNKELEAAQAKLDESKNRLKARICSIYMATDATTLDILLGAKNFSDFLDKLELVEYISKHDQELIDEVKGYMSSLDEEKAKLTDEQKQQEDVQEQLDANQQEYQDLVANNEELIGYLYTDNQVASDLLEDNSSALTEIDSQIEDYYAELKLKEEQLRIASQNAVMPDGVDFSNEVPTTSGRMWPTPGFTYLSSEWNEDRTTYNHGGIDITGPGIMWTKVVAPDDGTVAIASQTCTHNYGKSSSCGCGGGYGNWVMLDYGNGFSNVFGHLSAVTVSVGQTVKKGQVIGFVGSTGDSTGAHLHFEARYNGTKYNPMKDY